MGGCLIIVAKYIRLVGKELLKSENARLHFRLSIKRIIDPKIDLEDTFVEYSLILRKWLSYPFHEKNKDTFVDIKLPMFLLVFVLNGTVWKSLSPTVD